MKRAICTIIAKNYVGTARTLCRSFARFHPGVKTYVLVVDDYEGFIDPRAEEFELVPLAALGLPRQASLCFKYSVVELCTAVKAHLLEHLMNEHGIDQLLYIDPDIYVTAPLDQLFARLDSCDALLTPHSVEDYPADGLHPDTGTLLRYGVYNLGFFGVRRSPGGLGVLRWWQPKLLEYCVDDPLRGYYVDQKFMDVVPLFFENVCVERAPGYNVAYWNIHARRLEQRAGAWLCNGEPLYFYHFSNFDPSQPEQISGYQTRFRLSERPDLQPLFAEYTAALKASGHEEARRWRYTYNYFSTGEPIPRALRVLYRESPHKWAAWGPPFESAALKRLARWVGVKGKANYAFNALAYRYRRLTGLARVA